MQSITERLGISLSRRSLSASLRRALILAEYIREEKIGDITDRYTYFDDNDVYELSKYASRSMSEIAVISKKIKCPSIVERADLLAQRIRYGVKEDLIESKLVFLPEVGRTRGRRKSGKTNLGILLHACKVHPLVLYTIDLLQLCF